MLSEHETLELLEQLKHGVIPGTSGFGEREAVAVGHWPLLMGGGLCLNMQTVAALELNSQPESVVVKPTRLVSVRFAELTACFQSVHHISTGIDGRTLIIAYDSHFSPLLSVLQKNDFYTSGEKTTGAGGLSDGGCNAGGHYEFSQAVAAAIDAGPTSSGKTAGLSFLPLSAGAHALVGSWQLQLQHMGRESTLFIGLINTNTDSSIDVQVRNADTFTITVAVEKTGKTAGSRAMVAHLAWPREVTLERTERQGNFSLSFVETGDAARAEAGESSSAASLVVPGMLQLCSDDLYLLLVEAIGKATELTFRCETESLITGSTGLLMDGASHRCVSVNGLPIRQACVVVSEGQMRLECHR